MRLYSGMSEPFIRDAVQNRIAEKLRDAFFRQYRHQPAPSEVNSWRNSLRAVSQVLDDANLCDHGVILEYQLPLTSRRLDCLVCGRDDDARDVLHPSAQVGQYAQYLEDTHSAFYDAPSPVRLNSCAYLHNYFRGDGDALFDGKFASVLARYPTFTAEDVDPLERYLTGQVRGGQGHPVLRRIEQSRYRPSKKLMDHVGQVIQGHREYGGRAASGRLGDAAVWIRRCRGRRRGSVVSRPGTLRANESPR